MLKALSINNDKYYSGKKKRRIKTNNSSNIKSPIKLIPNNTALYRHLEYSDISPMNSIFNNINVRKNYNTINVNNNSVTKNKRIKNRSMSPIYKHNIYNLERCLTQNEKKFKRNVSQKIITNKKRKEQLINNTASLENEINNNYNELIKSKYNYYNGNKNIIQSLYNDKRIRLQNRSNNMEIYELKNDINNIQNKIDEFKRQTFLYINDYMRLNDELNNLKDHNRILPKIINDLEIENKNIIYKQIILHSNIQKIKSKLFELELNERNIKRNLMHVNMLYEVFC